MGFKIDDDPVHPASVEPDVNGFAPQVRRHLVPGVPERERVVFLYLPGFLGIEQLVIGLVGRQEADELCIQGEPVA